VNLKPLHVGFYGAVMGLAGLGLTARAAAPLFPGTFRAPAYFTELWVALGVLALALLLLLYFLKLLRNPAAVRDDFTNPLTMGFCAALPVGMSLVAGGVAPYSPLLGHILWWTAFGMLLAFQVWGLVRWLSGGIELAQVNAGWLILMVGGIVLPGPGIALGHDEAARFTFGVSASAAPVLMALLVYSRPLARWPFGPPWWAFTFPLDALAYAAVRYAQEHPSVLWKSIAAVALALATLFVTLVLLRTLIRR